MSQFDGAYFGELRRNIRPLAAASIASGTSLPLFAYTSQVFAPHLIAEFHWPLALFALIGTTMLTTIFVMPFVGRFTDLLGVRRIALLGTFLVPLCFVAYALQQGNFYYFMACSVATLALGSMTGPMVYTRLVAEKLERARGLALTIINSVPALVAAICVPLLNMAIIAFGWRVGYMAMAVVTLVGGLVAISMVPKDEMTAAKAAAAPFADEPAQPMHPAEKGDYRLILTSSIFWIIVAGLFLCLLQTPLHASQMNVMLVRKGLTTQEAANIGSFYAIGTILGRLACGLALDKFPTPIVTAVSLILPALGFFVLATNLDTLSVVTAAMFLVGISNGAENDIVAFLAARYFKVRIYATTLSLLYCANFITAALGAIGISWSLARTDSFSPFLYFVSGSILLGSLLFLLLPRRRSIAVG